MRLRPAEIEDVVRIGEIERASFGDPWTDDSLRSLISAPRVWFMVATIAGPPHLLGYLVAWFAADEGEITNLAVDPRYRDRRIGGQLLDAALAAALKRGAVTMYLEVRESNIPAQRLYASRGFEVTARRRRYYQSPVEDALVLRRTLAPPRPAD
ncbi:MAG: ribosomal protein S18-alanine N-acetyltransferase [Gemmatimonadaceae bacterium]